jgi:hypothetical protein
MLELKVIRKTKDNSDLICYDNYNWIKLWTLKNKTVFIMRKKFIFLRIFTKLYSSYFTVGDLDCYF